MKKINKSKESKINLIQVKLFNLDKSNFVMGQATMADANFCIDINIFPSDL